MSLTRMVYLHAITPIHSGTGQTAEVIDLPIAREKATGYPLIPASSFKGVARDGKTDATANMIFGTTDEAGALCFTDQRILCLPVRSYFGTFAYITCHLVLSRLTRDARAMGAALPFTVPTLPEATDTDDSMAVLLPTGSELKRMDNGIDRVYLEDLDLTARMDTSVTAISKGLAERLFPNDPAAFTARFAVVSDEVFSFLCETATEVTARIVLNEKTKTVENLWYEEAAPAETIFCGLVMMEAHQQTQCDIVLKTLTNLSTIQIGGNASVGRGLCRVIVGEGQIR